MKKISGLIIFVLLVSFLSINVYAVDIYENENNTINRTYNDYNNYGYISDSEDEDWWVISFAQEGMATFYLGSIPNYCDYDMKLYKNNVEIAFSASSANEFIRCHVYPNVDYKIKIYSFGAGNTSDSYKFRAKVYSLREAKIFTTDTSVSTLYTRDDAEAIIPSIWAMGFGATEYYNNSASAAYGAMPNADIYITSNHGDPGRLAFKNSYIYGANIGLSSADRSIENFSSSQLSDVDLVIYLNCYSSANPADYNLPSHKNLVTQTLSKGAFVCIGFSGAIYDNVSNYWIDRFFEACELGKTVANAIDIADMALRNNAVYGDFYTSMASHSPAIYEYNTLYANGLVLK